eukprot:1129765-Rhodomonas_salina.1
MAHRDRFTSTLFQDLCPQPFPGSVRPQASTTPLSSGTVMAGLGSGSGVPGAWPASNFDLEAALSPLTFDFPVGAL